MCRASLAPAARVLPERGAPGLQTLREPADHLDAYEDQEVAEEYEQEQQERRYALDYVQSSS